MKYRSSLKERAATCRASGKATKQSVQTLQGEKDELTLIQAEQQKQLDEARTAIENSQLLIAEYKDKNDSLTGLVTKYQGYAEENEQLKVAFAEEKEALLTAAATGNCPSSRTP